MMTENNTGTGKFMLVVGRLGLGVRSWEYKEYRVRSKVSF